jgi:hypothetical protein
VGGLAESDDVMPGATGEWEELDEELAAACMTLESVLKATRNELGALQSSQPVHPEPSKLVALLHQFQPACAAAGQGLHTAWQLLRKGQHGDTGAIGKLVLQVAFLCSVYWSHPESEGYTS